MKRLLLATLGMLIGVASPANAKSTNVQMERKVRHDKKARHGEKYLATVYLVPEQRDYSSRHSQWLLSRSGKKIARVSTAFAVAARLNGTARLTDGRLVHCVFPNGRCRVLKTKTVAGALGAPLRPFYSIAADPHRLRLGAKVWIPELQGLRLPDNTLHDGVCTVADTGGGIRNRHIDIYVGSKTLWRQFRAQNKAFKLPGKVTVRRKTAPLT